MENFFKQFKTGDIAVSCSSRTSAQYFLDSCHKNGIIVPFSRVSNFYPGEHTYYLYNSNKNEIEYVNSKLTEVDKKIFNWKQENDMKEKSMENSNINKDLRSIIQSAILQGVSPLYNSVDSSNLRRGPFQVKTIADSSNSETERKISITTPTFSLSNLKDGMVVSTLNKGAFLVLRKVLMASDGTTAIPMDHFNYDLTVKESLLPFGFRIDKVSTTIDSPFFGRFNSRNQIAIWERPKIKTISLKEAQDLLKQHGIECQIIED